MNEIEMLNQCELALMQYSGAQCHTAGEKLNYVRLIRERIQKGKHVSRDSLWGIVNSCNKFLEKEIVVLDWKP